MYYIYLLRCSDGSLYCGYTNNLKNRLAVHSRGKGAKYTRSRLPLELVYSESYDIKTDALKREYEIKQLTHSQKEQLILQERHN